MVESGPRKRKGDSDSAGRRKDDKKSDEKPKLFQGRYNPKLSDKNAKVSHKTLAKFVMAVGVVIFAVWSKMHQTNVHSLANVKEVIQEKRSQQFVCSPAYKREIQNLNSECLPLKCGRFVLDELVSEREAHQLLNIAKKGISKGGGAGGASILDLHSGALSHGEGFINLYKSHPQLFSKKDFNVYVEVKNRVKEAIGQHFNINSETLYLTHPTFFSELTAVPPVTVHDEYWHPHIDKETYPEFHFTSLVYLSDYLRDFTGGKFVFLDAHMKANRTIEPKEGRVSAFTSGPENKHHVEAVTGGTRYALTMGFTCDSSKAIQDPGVNL